MLALYIDVKTAYFLDTAHALHVKEDFVFKLLTVLCVNIKGLFFVLRVVELFIDLEIVVLVFRQSTFIVCV